MSTAGTPSTDPWIILSRERARYEEQFKTLKPLNGIITGDQAKSFFLQSQLPPLILGQIWALADTDADGKMNIEEFSIACKLINLKLRGFDVPKGLPPSLLASLKVVITPPDVPPLPNVGFINAPLRPEPPRQIPLISGLIQAGNIQTGIVPPIVTNIPTGIVPPMQSTTQPQLNPSPLITNIPLSSSTIQPLTSPPTIPRLPPPATTAILPPTMVPINTVAPLATLISPVTAQPTGIVPRPGASSTPRSSIGSLERTHSVESVSSQPEWSVPHQTKLKYTQIFNTTDRTRSGFLSGAQARNVMVQTKLPQNILATVWALSDMDMDGRLGCEEFVLAMHLCEQAALGNPPPVKLPPDLVPPSFRKIRTASISSQDQDPDPASTLLQNSFEDKRKENFEKGQAELDRRRKTLQDQQRQEREERERKEREDQEKLDKTRQQTELKRQQQLQQQIQQQQQQIQQQQQQQQQQAEQREIARKEMEKQRQLEWEKFRLQELQNQRQKQQENVLKLKSKNQLLTIEITNLNTQINNLSEKICTTRNGVSNLKTTIDNMRTTRDAQILEMSQLKNQLKEQNSKLLLLSQEKIKINPQNSLTQEITIKNLKIKLSDMEIEINNKLSDIDNNNTQLQDLKTQLKNLINNCEQLYSVYEIKRNTIMEMKNDKKNTDDNWPVDNWVPATDISLLPGVVKYRALYEFVARNNDEISFQPGDTINVPQEQTGEPGWLAGEIRGHTGWFPEAYVEPIDGIGVRDTKDSPLPTTEDAEIKRLEGIVEVPEVPEIQGTNDLGITVEEEFYISNYPYQSQEAGDLTFNAGEIIAVIKKDGDWWTGKFNGLIGIFPSNYVQKVDVTSNANTEPAAIQSTIEAVTTEATLTTEATSTIEAASTAEFPLATEAASTTDYPLATESPTTIELSTGVSAEAVHTALANVNAQALADNEVSQISFNKAKEEALAQAASGQVMKTKKPEIASVIAPYQSTSPEQLSLARGQLIMIRKKTDSGWWEGELQAKGRKRQVGWFPASYVRVLNSSGKISGRSTPVSTTRMQQEIVIDKVLALYPYTAGNPDELTFAKDDIISVTAREEEAWWRGELNGISGLFPSNYVTPLAQLLIPNKNRQESINEFIETEKKYISDMSIVHEVFEEPLRKSKLISTKEIDEIFVNWQDIIKCNKNFLKDLLIMESDLIGDIINKHLPEMNAYITFCGKQLDSASLLQNLIENSTAFRELVKKCQNNVATRGMPLSYYLIKPMQRITRYPLLINKILESTPDNHPDHKNLEESLKQSEKFLNVINETVRKKENEDRLNWLQRNIQNDQNIKFNSETNRLGPRQLLHHGIFNKLKNNKELLGFLFNDFFMLVIASKNLGTQFQFQSNNNVHYKLYKQPILVKNLLVNRDIDNVSDSNRVLIIQNLDNYKIALVVGSVSECSLWMKRIEVAKETCLKISNFDLQNKRKTRKSQIDNIYCKVILGNQEQETDVAKENLNGNPVQNNIPQIPTLIWNCSMQFQLRNINQEILNFVVYKQNFFSPDDFLGRAQLKVEDILRECENHNGPILKKLILHQVESGEILVKLDLHIFDNY